MSHIVVTGGAGRLGREVVADLLGRGHAVLAVDRVKPETLQCRFLPVELTDAAAVHDVLRGAEAVIHLGAVPGPTVQPPSTTFATNVMSTFHVMQAAAAHGLKKAVFASSVFTLGWHEDADRYWPRYVPVDEQHPLAPLEAYGLSKQIGEGICATVSAASGMPTVSLRIMNVIQKDGYEALPWPAPTRERGVRFVLWPYVDVRDAAISCRQALEAETAGHEAMFIAAEDTRFDAATSELLAELAPQVEIRQPLQGSAGVISIQKARRLIGFQPKYGWQAVRKK